MGTGSGFSPRKPNSAIVVVDEKRTWVPLPLSVYFHGVWYRLDHTKKHGGLISTRLIKPVSLVKTVSRCWDFDSAL